MRIWTIHPKYLDGIGLVSAWREGIGARNIIAENKIGYSRHPQLDRFRSKSVDFLNAYLYFLNEEAEKRGYKFDKSKIASFSLKGDRIPVNKGQVEYEFKLLQHKLSVRNKEVYAVNKKVRNIQVIPIYRILPSSKIEDWERIKEF